MQMLISFFCVLAVNVVAQSNVKAVYGEDVWETNLATFFQFASAVVLVFSGVPPFMEWVRHCRNPVAVKAYVLYDIIQEPEMIVPLFQLIVCILGFTYYFYCSLLLLDLIFLSNRLSNVIRAVTTNITDIASTFTLMIIVVYIFTAFGLYEYGQLLVFEVEDSLALNQTSMSIGYTEDYSLCPNLGICLLEFIDAGLRSGDIVDAAFDDFTFKDGEGAAWAWKIMYGLLFFLIIGVILFDIVTGIIIDTFGMLREELQARNTIFRNNSFIADIDRVTYEEQGWSFDALVKEEHDPFLYVYLIAHLHEKDEDRYSGAESFISNAIKEADISWLPEKTSWKMQMKDIAADLEDTDDLMEKMKNDLIAQAKEENSKLEASIMKKIERQVQDASKSQEIEKILNELKAMMLRSGRFEGSMSPLLGASDEQAVIRSDRLSPGPDIPREQADAEDETRASRISLSDFRDASSEDPTYRVSSV